MGANCPLFSWSALGSNVGSVLLRVLHFATQKMLNRAGYIWEPRRRGELQIGVWRKSLRKKQPQSAPFGTKLVLIPGFGDTPLSWWPLLVALTPLLKRHYDELVLLDFPGYAGFLAQERPFDSMDRLEEVLTDVLDGLQPDTLLGHSLGGWLLARYAVRSSGERANQSPRRVPVRQLVLVDPAGVFESESARSAWIARWERVLEEGFAALKPHLFAKTPFWFRAVEREFSAFVGREDLKTFMRSVREEHFLGPELSKVATPVSILWGEHDALLPAATLSRWMERIPHARGAVIQGAGHSPHLEKPVVTAALLAQLLLGREPRRELTRFYKVLPSSPHVPTT